MRQKKLKVVLLCLLICMLSGCAKPENALKGLTEDKILYLDLVSRKENEDSGKRIVVDFEEGTIYIGKETDFYSDAEDLVKRYPLTTEEERQLRSLIADYSHTVIEKEDSYWPNTDEYPAMFVLFKYEVGFGEESYSADGALCYPDGWEAFMEKLEGYAGGEK